MTAPIVKQVSLPAPVASASKPWQFITGTAWVVEWQGQAFYYETHTEAQLAAASIDPVPFYPVAISNESPPQAVKLPRATLPAIFLPDPKHAKLRVGGGVPKAAVFLNRTALRAGVVQFLGDGGWPCEVCGALLDARGTVMSKLKPLAVQCGNCDHEYEILEVAP